MQKEKTAKSTADYLLQIRQLQSSRMQSVSEQPLYSAFLFPGAMVFPMIPSLRTTSSRRI